MWSERSGNFLDRLKAPNSRRSVEEPSPVYLKPHGSEQGVSPVPDDLDADAKKEKGGKANDNGGSGFSEHPNQQVRKTITKENAGRDEPHGEHGCHHNPDVDSIGVPHVCAYRDGHRDRARPDGQGQGQ